MDPNMNWWLISTDDLRIIRHALVAPTHAINEYPNCEDWPIGYGCDGCRGDKLREEAVHVLDSGMHKTDAVPEDFQKEQNPDES